MFHSEFTEHALYPYLDIKLPILGHEILVMFHSPKENNLANTLIFFAKVSLDVTCCLQQIEHYAFAHF